MLLRLLVVLAGLVVVVDGAWACACCSNPGYRRVEIMTLERSYEREVIGQVRFRPPAQLYSGEAEPADIKGIARGISMPASEYDLEVAQRKDHWVFAFRDKAGRSGTLVLSMPKSMSVSEVDPRQGWGEKGSGPILYKEWQLRSRAAGTGIFTPGIGRGQSITLILQGRGLVCAAAEDFTHWTLAVSGPVAKYHLFGELVPPQRDDRGRLIDREPQEP